jgi:hypothetical protein
MPFEWSLHPPILHGTYHHPSEIPPVVHRLATEYEGTLPHRMGFNLPLTSTGKQTLKDTIKLAWDNAQYLIVYPKKDPQTRRHELLHARYHLDPAYRQHVETLWQSLTPKQQQRVRQTLRALHYPDTLLLDEFQAYYYTEKPRFFGLPAPSVEDALKRKAPLLTEWSPCGSSGSSSCR